MPFSAMDRFDGVISSPHTAAKKDILMVLRMIHRDPVMLVQYVTRMPFQKRLEDMTKPITPGFSTDLSRKGEESQLEERELREVIVNPSAVSYFLSQLAHQSHHAWWDE